MLFIHRMGLCIDASKDYQGSEGIEIFREP